METVKRPRHATVQGKIVPLRAAGPAATRTAEERLPLGDAGAFGKF